MGRRINGVKVEGALQRGLGFRVILGGKLGASEHQVAVAPVGLEFESDHGGDHGLFGRAVFHFLLPEEGGGDGGGSLLGNGFFKGGGR